VSHVEGYTVRPLMSEHTRNVLKENLCSVMHFPSLFLVLKSTSIYLLIFNLVRTTRRFYYICKKSWWCSHAPIPTTVWWRDRVRAKINLAFNDLTRM